MIKESKYPLPDNVPTELAREAIRTQRRAFLQCLEELLGLEDDCLRDGVVILQKMIIEGMMKDKESSE